MRRLGACDMVLAIGCGVSWQVRCGVLSRWRMLLGLAYYRQRSMGGRCCDVHGDDEAALRSLWIARNYIAASSSGDLMAYDALVQLVVQKLVLHIKVTLKEAR